MLIDVSRTLKVSGVTIPTVGQAAKLKKKSERARCPLVVTQVTR